MKKILFTSMMLLGAMSANAQFTVYQPIYEPTYASPYRQQQQARPKRQEVTLKGYYKKGNDWYFLPIRVGIIGEEVTLLSIKTQNVWSNCGSKASAVGGFDSEEIRDNFNYKAFTSIYGTIYF